MPNLLRLRDVTARLGVTHPTVYRLIHEGKFPPPIKIGAAARWEPEAVERYIKGLRRVADAGAEV